MSVPSQQTPKEETPSIHDEVSEIFNDYNAGPNTLSLLPEPDGDEADVTATVETENYCNGKKVTMPNLDRYNMTRVENLRLGI